MPYTFPLMFGAMFWIPICFVGTLILCSFIYKPEKFRIAKRILLSFLAAIVIPVSFVLLIVCIDCMHTNDYWRHQGNFDTFRVPLEPPYELVGSSSMAQIQIWQDDSYSSVQLGSITCYEKRGYLIFGETCEEFIPSRRTEQDKGWFIFDLSNGNKEIFENKEKFVEALTNRRNGNIKLKDVFDNWNEYWKNPRNKASDKPSSDSRTIGRESNELTVINCSNGKVIDKCE